MTENIIMAAWYHISMFIAIPYEHFNSAWNSGN